MEESPQLETAKNNYENLITDEARRQNDYSALAGLKVIERLEPRLHTSLDGQPLLLSLQSDAKGQSGDVRDLICRSGDWEIGVSCKHNHEALKHSRLSPTIDFGSEWLGFPCSDKYFASVTSLFDELKHKKDEAIAEGKKPTWDEYVPDKESRYYRGVLDAFMDEFQRIYKEHPEEVATNLIQYMYGRYDFYKLIADIGKQATWINAINIKGDLCKSAGKEKPITKIPKPLLPKRVTHVGYRHGKGTTIEILLDEGWSISLRIHSASSRIETSFKFDVQELSSPSCIYSQIEPWGNISSDYN